jgi:hypothetical protein
VKAKKMICGLTKAVATAPDFILKRASKKEKKRKRGGKDKDGGTALYLV